MDNEGKAGAGRAVEQADHDIDRRGSDERTIAGQARDAGEAIAGAGPEIARHIARDNPRTSSDADDDEDEDEDMDDDGTSTDEDDEDDLETEEEDDDVGVEAEDEERGTPGYGDRGNTPI
jgi:hypothetical protein